MYSEGTMDVEEERRCKIEEGRRRLEKLKAKKENDKNAVHAAKKPLPSPFAATARKPFPEFKLPESGRKSSQATPREVIADKGVAANKENVHVKSDTKQQQQRQKENDDEVVGELLASGRDMSDAKNAVEDQISRLRELDKSYTQPPHRDPVKSYSQPPHPVRVTHSLRTATLQQQQQQTEQQHQQKPDDAKLPEKEASEQISPEPAQSQEQEREKSTGSVVPAPTHAHEQVPANSTGIMVNAPMPGAPTEYLSPSKLSSAPTGYLSASKMTGAPTAIHFGTGLTTRNTQK